MTKKEFFATSRIVAFCALATLVMFSCKPKQKEIGLQLWSVRDSMQTNAKRTIEEVAKMGYKFVEGAGYNDGKFYGMEPAAFKALLEANNLTMLSSHTGKPVPDSAKWNEVMAWWDQCIDAHIAVGAKYIIQPFMDSVGYAGLAGSKRYCDYFNAVGEKCKAKGLLFGYHNHNHEFADVEGTTFYDYMLQNTDSTKVFFELDLWWIHEGGKKAEDYFAKYPGRFLFYHVKDEKELGASGKMDFKPYFDGAKQSGMKHYVVEVEAYTTGNELESVKKSFDFLNTAEYVK
jgi:sugar phosphate isomerase/epimerase